MTANNRGGLTPYWPPPNVYYQWFMRVNFWASPKPVAWVLLTIPSLQPRGWGMENSKVGTGPTTGLCCRPEWVRRERSGSCWDRGTSKGRKDLRNICNLTPCNEQIQLNKYLQVALSLIKPKKLGDVHGLLLLPGMRLCMWHVAQKKGVVDWWGGRRGCWCSLPPTAIPVSGEGFCDLGIFLPLGRRWMDLRHS